MEGKVRGQGEDCWTVRLLGRSEMAGIIANPGPEDLGRSTCGP
jgi:hypothetical protein